MLLFLMQKVSKNSNKRILFFAFCLIFATSLVIYRLFTLTFTQHEVLAKSAKMQQESSSIQLLGRGNIYAYDHSTGKKKLLATNQSSENGVQRLYPDGDFAGHILGFVGFKGYERVGQYGVEGYYDNKLFENDIVLTIDPNIQSYVESKLDALLIKWSSPHGTIIVQEPSTGAIIAMASSPSYNPNTYASYGLEDYLNPSMQEQYEPGSSFKAFTMSAAIDSGSVTPQTTYIDTGEVKINKYTIRNFDNTVEGLQTMTQVLEHSLNTGVIFAQRKTGLDKFLNYIVAFGFGQKTGVDLMGEVSGNISNLYENHEVNFATAAFGQGVAVTSMQLINGYSAIANGGKLMQPYIVKEIIHSDGSTTPTKPKVIGNPITERSADIMKTMLVSVVDNGFDAGRVSGYDVAGKTGTAQIPKKDGGYLEDQYIHDFVGFAPAYAPRFVVLIKMERPQGIRFASRSLSPVFADITQYLLRYLKIPPTR